MVVLPLVIFDITHCFRRNSSQSSLFSPNACILHVNVLSKLKINEIEIGDLLQFQNEDSFPDSYPNCPKQMFR